MSFNPRPIFLSWIMNWRNSVFNSEHMYIPRASSNKKCEKPFSQSCACVRRVEGFFKIFHYKIIIQHTEMNFCLQFTRYLSFPKSSHSILPWKPIIKQGKVNRQITNRSQWFEHISCFKWDIVKVNWKSHKSLYPTREHLWGSRSKKAVESLTFTLLMALRITLWTIHKNLFLCVG